jgi:drug/metabolite transporter superfamily protein YnfA
MAVALSIFGVAFAAFCVWLTVRIINRRERWAKWTVVALTAFAAIALLVQPPTWARVNALNNYGPEPIRNWIRWAMQTFPL